MKCRGAAQVCRCPAGRHMNLFKVFFGLRKRLAGMGCKAQRAAHIHPRWPVLLASGVTPQTARQATCPKGWSEIGRLGAPAACMGMSPCGAPGASTHPDCTPMQSPKRL